MNDYLLGNALAILALWGVAVITPGPNFLAVTTASVHFSKREGLATVMGIAFGTLLWAVGSLLGLGLLFKTASGLYTAVKLVGAAYLVYAGLKLIRSAPKPVNLTSDISKPEGICSFFLKGLMVDLANPKAAAFFTSLIAVTMPPDAPLWFNAFIILSIVAMTGVWYSLVACFFTLKQVSSF